MQELRCREEDLNRAQLQQRLHEEQLRQKEQELQAREIDLLERELHLMITQQTPTPNKRKGVYYVRVRRWLFYKNLCVHLRHVFVVLNNKKENVSREIQEIKVKTSQERTRIQY